MNESFRPAPGQDVAISSRVRLARNYRDIPFMPNMTDEWAEESIRRATEAIASGPDATAYTGVRLREISEARRQQLVEHRLISYDLLKYTPYAAALLSSGRTVTVMINEEDHLRVQGLLPGLQAERAAEMTFRADEALAEHAAFAFDEQWGYLTACPANAGTGMRVSVLLHLPALAAANQIGVATRNIASLGITLRGFYGDGSEAMGNIYLVSNQSALGRREEDVLRSMEAAVSQVCGHERAIRDAISKQDSLLLEDRLMRGVGILREARILSLRDYMRHMSEMRFACAIGLMDAPLGYIDQLIMDLQPGSLDVAAGRTLSQREADEMRAARIREEMRKSPIG